MVEESMAFESPAAQSRREQGKPSTVTATVIQNLGPKQTKKQQFAFKNYEMLIPGGI